MRPSRAALVLSIVASDSTFAPMVLRGERCFVGKCIHCNTKLVVAATGATAPGVTIEHILPKTHGGTDAPENVALACARCNAGKGVRHDSKRADDPAAVAVVETLRARRRERWR